MTAVGSLAWFSRPAMAALPVAQWARVEPARHTVFRYAVWLAGGLPFLAAVYGATAGRLRYRVVTVEVPITDLPPQLDGLRIVHLSDIHIGAFMPRAAIRRAVDMSNAVQPDLAVLTGDLISNEHDPLEDCIAELSRLAGALGVWGCHGNHERWAGVEARGQALFARYGMHVLRQQCVELSWRGGHFNLIGVDDQRERARPGEPSSMLRSIEGLVRPDIPNILLSHNPETFPRAAAWASSSASRATRMVVRYALRSGTASGVRPASSRRLWRACIACPYGLAAPPSQRRAWGMPSDSTLSCMSIRGWARLDSPCAWGCHRRSRCSRSERRGTQLRGAGTPSKVHSSTSMPFGHCWNLFTVVSLPSTAVLRSYFGLSPSFNSPTHPLYSAQRVAISTAPG